MKLKHVRRLVEPGENVKKVADLAWSTDGERLAVATERTIRLFSAEWELKESFSIKQLGEAGGNKTLRALSVTFNPAGTRLAIAQSDNIVTVYTLNGEIRALSNKFQQTSGVNALAWLTERPNEVVIGLAEGRVKVGMLKGKKTARLYEHAQRRPVRSIAKGHDGLSFICGHDDGSVYIFKFSENQNGKPMLKRLFTSESSPEKMAFGSAIAVGGPGGLAVHSSEDGKEVSKVTKEEATSVSFARNGDVAVAAVREDVVFITREAKRKGKRWVEEARKPLWGVHRITCARHHPDGGKVAVGGICGDVHIFDTFLVKARLEGRLDARLISPTEANVKNLRQTSAMGMRMRIQAADDANVRSKVKFSVHENGKHVVAMTDTSVAFLDLLRGKSVDLKWKRSNHETFFFRSSPVISIYDGISIFATAYGENDIKLRYSPGRRPKEQQMSAIALTGQEKIDEAFGGEMRSILLAIVGQDSRSINILDTRDMSAKHGHVSETIQHTGKVKWVQVTSTGSHVLFKDSRKALLVVDMETQEREVMCHSCQFVEMIPDGSGIVVAQSNDTLIVWKTMHGEDRSEVALNGGEVEGIERREGRTSVLVAYGEEEGKMQRIELETHQRGFNNAMSRNDHVKAASILEEAGANKENTLPSWKRLKNASMETMDIGTLERSCANLQMYSMMHAVRGLAGKHADDETRMRAELLALDSQFDAASNVLVSAGRAEDAVDMLIQVGQVERATTLAMQTNVSGQTERKRVEYMMANKMENDAAGVLMQKGDLPGAVSTWLRAGMPSRAARAATEFGASKLNKETLTSIFTELDKYKLNELAGDLSQAIREHKKAKEKYINGKRYDKAVEVAREHFPEEVTNIEALWASLLVSKSQPEHAIGHFVEANDLVGAAGAAIDARHWHRARELMNEIADNDSVMKLKLRMAEECEAARAFELAIGAYVEANEARRAVDMLARNAIWERAQRLAGDEVGEEEAREICKQRARALESQNKIGEAEKVLMAANEYDDMFELLERHERYSEISRQLSANRPNELVDFHRRIGRKMEEREEYGNAEKHYIEAGGYRECIQMHRERRKWSDALRVARAYTPRESGEIAREWSVSVGVDGSVKELGRHNAVEEAIDASVGKEGFIDHALSLASRAMPEKLERIHQQKAEMLETRKETMKAEEHYIAANRPKEAITMHAHNKDWPSAMRVAKAYDEKMIQQVQIRQANDAVEEENNLEMAERLFIEASVPEKAVQMHLQANRLEEALRVSESHVPARSEELRAAIGARDMGKSEGSERNTERARQVAGSNEQSERKSKTRQQGADELARKGEWERAHKEARNGGEEMALRFSFNHAQELMSNNDSSGAIRTLEANGVPGELHNLELYKRLGWIILSSPFAFDDVRCLENVTRAIVKGGARSSSDLPKSWQQFFESMCEAAHFAAIAARMRQARIHNVAGDAATTVLRHLSEGPIDRAYLEAGNMQRKAGNEDVAFMLLNRLLDMTDAIESKRNGRGGGEQKEEESGMEETDFRAIESLPGVLSITREELEEARVWVLDMSMGSSREIGFPKKRCESCKEEIFAANVHCPLCLTKETNDVCNVTGHPIGAGEKVTCSRCNVHAKQIPWNRFVEVVGLCPCCQKAQGPRY